MNSEELKTKYKELYKLMAEGKDPEKMHIFGHAEKHIFRELADRDPATAERWLAMLMAVEWDNYLGKVADALGYKLTFEPKKTYYLDPYGKTVGEFRRHLAGSGTEFVEIGRTLISCNDPAKHPYDVARIEEMHIDSMRPRVIELIVTMR